MRSHGLARNGPMRFLLAPREHCRKRPGGQLATGSAKCRSQPGLRFGHLSVFSAVRYCFFFKCASFAAMKARISADISSSFSHCSLYKVTGKRPIP